MIYPEVEAILAARHSGARLDWVRDDRATSVTVRDAVGSVTRYVIVGDFEDDPTGERDRAERIVRSGLLRSLPAGVASGVTDVVTIAGDRHLLLTLDLPRVALDAEGTRAVLAALARMHSAFAGFPARLTSGLGLLPLGQWLNRDGPGPDARDLVTEGWSSFAARLPDAWARIKPLLRNPAPLVDALREFQPTIVQGRPTPTELSITAGSVVFHDWGIATRGPGGLDLGAFVASTWPIPGTGLADCVEVYRAERARLGRLPAAGELWQHEATLGLLAGVLRYGWLLAGRADDLDEWSALVASGHDALG